VRTAVAVVLLWASVARAQPVPEATPAVAPQPAAAEPPADPRSDAGWQLYHDAFDALLHGQRARARDLATQLIRQYPEHPATKLVQAAALGAGPGIVDTYEPPPPPTGPVIEKPSRGARAELALFQTLHGMYVGIEVCLLADCNSGEAGFGLALAGAGTGAIVSLNIGELTSGQRALLNSGTIWGAVNAGLLIGVTEPDSTQSVVGTLLAGQGLGLFLGAGLYRSHATAGQVALANSGGEWGFALTGLTMAALDQNADSKDVFLVLLGAVDAGLGVGAYLASRNPQVSRGQTLVIDAGGIVGAVAGGSVGILISGDFNDRSTPGGAAIGAAVGLATAAYFTRHWSARSDGSPVEAFIRPVEHARGGVAGIGFQW
jgi:hypothetical protein